MADDPLTSCGRIKCERQIDKDIRCAELDFVVANQIRDRLPLTHPLKFVKEHIL